MSLRARSAMLRASSSICWDTTWWRPLPARTFTEVTDQLPARVRCLTRLRTALPHAVVAWRRVGPWVTTFVDLRTGQVVGLVEGYHSAAVTTWLATKPVSS